MKLLQSVNPATGKVIAEYAAYSTSQVMGRILRAEDAQRVWSETDFKTRASRLGAAAELLRSRAENYAELMANEMGKPVKEGVGEVVKCAQVCEHYAELAPHYLADEVVDTEATKSYVCYRPLGVLLAVMPWNYPFWQVFRFAAPALMAGNAGLLKHASNVTGCSLAIQQLLRDAGFPEHLFQSILLPGSSMEKVIAHPSVRAISLTGSTPAGREVASFAGKYLKKTILELGGSDPFIVLEDADLQHAASLAAKARMLCGGQSCIAAKRFIVVESVYADFERLLVDAMSRIVVGAPLEQVTDMGPLARMDLREELHRQVIDSVYKGAEIMLGGVVQEGAGAYYPPTVLRGVTEGMPAYHEELFGPVAALIRVRDEAHAIEIANDTEFGLGAAVMTRNVARGEWIAARQLNAGSCFVNAFVKSDPRLPFGGIRDSGYGRELGAAGIRELCNVKTVYVA